MTVLSILDALSAQLEWVVLFRLSAFRRWADDSQMKAMFRLPAHFDLQPVSFVILTSRGRFLAPLGEGPLRLVNEGRLEDFLRDDAALLERRRGLFEMFDADSADCLGFATTDYPAPALLHLRVIDDEGYARAVFYREPSRRNYELLRAIGVEYIDGRVTESGFIASFRNRLATHFHTGELAGYSRAGNCNQFFFNHGEIDNKIESGLLQAAQSRVAWAREKGLGACRELAWNACTSQLAVTCQPPPPREPHPYGDVAPLGFLLHALARNAPNDGARAALREKLISSRKGLLWPFHSGKLVTSTDSVLVLQGVQDNQSTEALEIFSDGFGAYYPQLWSQTKEPGHMVITPARAHWCQPDLATTCLARALRAHAGLTTVTPLAYLEQHFETRSGLYFANPYFVDWTMAWAVAKDEDAAHLKRHLRDEILNSMNPDYSFGTYDVALSTSFAILALAELGCRGRLLLLAQLRLQDMMDAESGTWPECIPFYSTEHASKPPEIVPCDEKAQTIFVNGAWHDLTLYVDSHRVVSTSVAVLALSRAYDPEERESIRVVSDKHPRYACASHAEYVAEFALRPYVGERENKAFARQ